LKLPERARPPQLHGTVRTPIQGSHGFSRAELVLAVGCPEPTTVAVFLSAHENSDTRKGGNLFGAQKTVLRGDRSDMSARSTFLDRIRLRTFGANL
jgi:hypothetical protein